MGNFCWDSDDGKKQRLFHCRSSSGTLVNKILFELYVLEHFSGKRVSDPAMQAICTERSAVVCWNTNRNVI